MMTDESPEPFALRMQAIPTALADVRSALRTWLSRSAVAAAVRSDIVLVVDEAVANCVEHATTPNHVPVEFTVTASLEAHDLFVTVSDNGRWQGHATRNGTRGRGIPLMAAIMSSVDIVTAPTGTTVHMVRKL
jgi:serine/threonine-protein kinase RsbW